VVSRTTGKHNSKTAPRSGSSGRSGRRGERDGGADGTDALQRYREKRRFDRTAEPRGGEAAADGAPSFVVQIHDASTMHFDFRLEVDGVLKSWSVPKGPSPDPREKRLAMPTEDHPMEYRDFEGIIPAGEYGGGTVIVWDQGTYRPLTGDFAAGLRRGHVKFWLDGTKLRGGYALTRFRGGRDGGREAWLLVKENDARAARDGKTPDPVRARSARTSRTLKQVSAQATEEDTWHSR
jgi:DNA ligase D-like protein (predicted 3'-phosphoesterase)